MTNFEGIVDKWDLFNIPDFINSRTKNDVKQTLGKKELKEQDLLTLLSPAADSFLEEIARKSREITDREFGKTIQIYTPLYLSSYCKNRCIYCGFNEENSIPRSKLSEKELREECRRLQHIGIKHILLLTGGDRINTPIDYISSSVEIAKEFFDSISIEMYAMSEKEYKSLMELGVDNVTIYQETYNKELYKKVHLSGEKSHYSFRLEAPMRAAIAGARSVNLGALLGLGNPIQDFFIAALHSKFIRDNYPGCDVALSFPRLREANSDYIQNNIVTDKLLVKMVMAYRLFIQRGGISISTRESMEFRNNILPLGVTKMSAQSKTSVGDSGDEQFKISDERTVSELDRDLRQLGYQPVYKDWVLL